LEEEEFKTASEISEILEISVQKASAVLRQAVSEGKVEVEDVKVKGKGTQKGYRLRSEKVDEELSELGQGRCKTPQKRPDNARERGR
jgi:predicted ArsR family transcriptional regulator